MDLEATPEERIQLEYATQHFGFTPDSFVETITTTAVEKINEDLDVSLLLDSQISVLVSEAFFENGKGFF